MSFSMSEIAAIIFTSIAMIIAAFHLLLAFGWPLGNRVMGGKFSGQWSPKMRLVAVFIVCFWLFFSLVVLAQVGYIIEEFQDISKSTSWIIVVFSGIQVVLHVITPSKEERKFWLPITLILLITSLVVAVNRT